MTHGNYSYSTADQRFIDELQARIDELNHKLLATRQDAETKRQLLEDACREIAIWKRQAIDLRQELKDAQATIKALEAKYKVFTPNVRLKVEGTVK